MCTDDKKNDIPQYGLKDLEQWQKDFEAFMKSDRPKIVVQVKPPIEENKN